MEKPFVVDPKNIKWVNGADYLNAKTQKDVRNHSYWKDHPVEHCIRSLEQAWRTWPGDPKAKKGKAVPKPNPKPKPTPKPNPKPMSHKVRIDGFTGGEGSTAPIPKDDNPEYDRHNVVRAWGKIHWYSSRHVYGKKRKWVDYKPDWKKLGEGYWNPVISFLMTKNRAKHYDAYYYHVVDGKEIFLTKVNHYFDGKKNGSINLGKLYFKQGDFIRVSDNYGTSSVSFGSGQFKRVNDSNTLPPNPTQYTKRKIAEVKGQSFMSMEQISKNELIAGCYSAAATSKVFVITILGNGKFKAQMVDQPKTGEAAFRARRIGNIIWFAMEDRLISKCVYKANPMDYKFEVFKKLKDGLNDGAFDVRKLLNKTVFLGCEIYTLGHGTRKEFGNDYYCKFLFEANNKAFAGGYNAKENRAGWFESTNALTWKWESIGVKYNRFMQTLVSHDQKTLWLVGTKNYKGGHNSDSARLWRYDFKTKKLRTLYTFKGFDYSSCIKRTTSGKIVIGLTKRWKGKEVGAKLIHWDGKPHDIATFDEAEIREIVCIGSKTYCATRTNRVRGRVYEVSGL